MESRRPRLPSLVAVLSLPGGLLASAVLVLLALVLATHLTLRNAYSDEAHQVLVNSDRSAQKLAVRVRQVLDQVDQTTQFIKALHETHNPMDLGALRHASLDASEVTLAMLVADSQGQVQDRTADAVPASVADAPGFKRHRDRRDHGLTLAPPQPNPLGTGWAIPAMRRLDTQTGNFDGVVLAYVDPNVLTRGFDAGELPRTSIGVLGDDDIFRALLLDGHFTVGSKIDHAVLLQRARVSSRDLMPTPSKVDGVPRFVTLVPVERYPLFAVVAVPAEEALVGYRHTRQLVLCGAAAIAAAVLIGTALLWHQVRRLDQSRRRAHRAESMYRAASEGSLDALFMLSARRGGDGAIEDFVFTDANSRGLRLMGQGLGELIGQTLSARLPSLSHAGYLDRCQEVVTSRVGFELEFSMTDFGSEAGWLHHQVVPLEDGIAIIGRDITSRKTAQEQLDALARLDPLTQLPNRRSFEERLEQAAARARRSEKPLTLVFLDLDGFKHVNDTLGHAAGDQLLIEVARRLRACVRTTDHVSRLGGDEFTVILEESGNPEDRLAQCERLLSSVSRPHLLAGMSVVATPSLGVAVYTPGEALQAFRDRADAAMYEAKRAGKACLRWAPMALPAGSETSSPR